MSMHCWTQCTATTRYLAHWWSQNKFAFFLDDSTQCSYRFSAFSRSWVVGSSVTVFSNYVSSISYSPEVRRLSGCPRVLIPPFLGMEESRRPFTPHLSHLCHLPHPHQLHCTVQSRHTHQSLSEVEVEDFGYNSQCVHTSTRKCTYWVSLVRICTIAQSKAIYWSHDLTYTEDLHMCMISESVVSSEGPSSLPSILLYWNAVSS